MEYEGDVAPIMATLLTRNETALGKFIIYLIK